MNEPVEVTVNKLETVQVPCTYQVQVCKPETQTHTVKVCHYESQVRTCAHQVCEYHCEMRTRTCTVTECKYEQRTREVSYIVCEPRTETRNQQVTTCETAPVERTVQYTVMVPHTVEKKVQVQVCKLVEKTHSGSRLPALCASPAARCAAAGVRFAGFECSCQPKDSQYITAWHATSSARTPRKPIPGQSLPCKPAARAAVGAWCPACTVFVN